MPAITSTSVLGDGAIVLNETTLNGTDSFTYKKGDLLILRNPTGSPISPTIDGDGGTSVIVPGIGSVSVAAGWAVGSIPANSARVIPLDTRAEYCKGTVAITSGTGLIAAILRV
jgi:hypothetical protein